MQRVVTILRRIAHQPWLAVLVLLVPAVLLRVAFHLELADTPYHEQHAWQETDMAFFAEWADHLAQRDWLDR